MSVATPAVLSDSLPAGLTRDLSLVAGGAVVTGVLSQVVVPLPFTPVPLSLGTFAVLLVGATLGPVRGVLSMLLYLVAGMAGGARFAETGAGWGAADSGSGVGYRLARGPERL